MDLLLDAGEQFKANILRVAGALNRAGQSFCIYTMGAFRMSGPLGNHLQEETWRAFDALKAERRLVADAEGGYWVN